MQPLEPSSLGPSDAARSAEPSHRPTLFDVEPGASRLVDPFLDHRQAPAPTKPLSRAALASLLLPFLLGPIGSLAALPVGLVARRHTASGSIRGRALANSGIALGALTTLAWLGLAVGLVVSDLEGRRVTAAEVERGARDLREHDAPSSPPPVSTVEPGPSAGPRVAIRRSLPADGTVPRVTRERSVGALTVVDVGVEEASLRSALEQQRAKARAAGEELLVMTVASSCVPCDGVQASLEDPRMQTALEKVRLVRVDLEVFREDLARLKMQAERYPGYFLLSEDLTPRDAIDGGEWGEDIAENIAPVLGPFVRGRYRDRKHEWRGVFL